MTPALEKLARSGVILEQSYTQQVCTPSRAALLTGKYPFHIGRQKRALKPLQPTGLSVKLTTLPQQLQRLGYTTHMVGKWHLGYCSVDYTPTRRGFDTFLGFYLGSQEYFTHSRDYKEKETDASDYLDFRENLAPTNKYNNKHSTQVFRDRTIDILDEIKAGRELNAYQKYDPFFIYLSFQATHAPLQAREETLKKIPQSDNFARDIYKAMVLDMDQAVDKIVRRLKANNLYNDTIIVFTSDNGAAISHGGGSNYPLRGTKGTLFEGGTRAVTFVHAPPELLEKRGYTHTRLMHVTDWMPTLLRLAGYKGDPVKDLGLDGVDQWQGISTDLGEEARQEMVYNLKAGPTGAIRVGDYKLLFGKKFNKQGWYDIDTQAIKCSRLYKDKKGQRKQATEKKKDKKSSTGYPKIPPIILQSIRRQSRRIGRFSRKPGRRQAGKRKLRSSAKQRRKEEKRLRDRAKRKEKEKEEVKITKIWKNWIPQPDLETQALIRWQMSNCSVEDFTRIGHYSGNSLKPRLSQPTATDADQYLHQLSLPLPNPFNIRSEDEDAEFEDWEQLESLNKMSFDEQFDLVDSALYNVRDDPEERFDLKAEYPDIFQKLRSRVVFHLGNIVPEDFPEPDPSGHPRYFNGTFSPGWCISK